MRKVAVGVDIGGTNVKLGLVDEKGKILARRNFLTSAGRGRSGLLNLLSAHILSLMQEAKRRGLKLSGVGIGAPGPIDVNRGFVYFFPNIPGWRNTPLKKLLEPRLKTKITIDNDANAMAWAEFLFGAGRGSRNIVALTLGTGIGGGIVLGGRLFHGPTYSAAEIGHMIINESGTKCACGNRGCVEAYVGNGYFTAELRRRLRRGAPSLLRRWLAEGRDLTPLLAAQAATRGDKIARALWKETAEHLGTALAGLINVLNPERVIIGGGIAQNRPFIFPQVIDTIHKKAFPIAARSVRVVPAALGVDAGLIGAAALAF